MKEPSISSSQGPARSRTAMPAGSGFCRRFRSGQQPSIGRTDKKDPGEAAGLPGQADYEEST